jgi:hypothetical protein
MIDMLKEIILDFQEIDLPMGVPRRAMISLTQRRSRILRIGWWTIRVPSIPSTT